MGSIYRKGKRLYAAVKSASGEWKKIATGCAVGQEREAKKFMRDLEARARAGAAHGEADLGPLTVRRYVHTWILERRNLGLADCANDEARLRDHVLPVLGDLPIADVRARHVVDLFKKLRATGKHAPKTLYNVYSVVKAVFRDAQMEDLVDTSPCVLTKYQLGENVDADPEWRVTAIFSRDELERLISEPLIPVDRRVMYALEGIGALRHGEAAGLRWRHHDPDQKPLGSLLVATSYNRGHTKTKLPRRMPVHPVLASLLAEWKSDGWPKMMGRLPQPDDLIVPLPPEHLARRKDQTDGEGMRNKTYSFKRIRTDLEVLGLRHRRSHDLRRTMITLARTDGARRDILELCTHTPKDAGAIDLYTTFPWESLCQEVAKLNVSRGSGSRSRHKKNQAVTASPFYRFSTGDENVNDSEELSSGGAGSRTFGTDHA